MVWGLEFTATARDHESIPLGLFGALGFRLTRTMEPILKGSWDSVTRVVTKVTMPVITYSLN